MTSFVLRLWGSFLEIRVKETILGSDINKHVLGIFKRKNGVFFVAGNAIFHSLEIVSDQK